MFITFLALIFTVPAVLSCDLHPYDAPEPQDVVADQPERFFVGEIIRKHVFLQYHQEVPYCVAVEVVDYKVSACSCANRGTVQRRNDMNSISNSSFSLGRRSGQVPRTLSRRTS